MTKRDGKNCFVNWTGHRQLRYQEMWKQKHDKLYLNKKT